jgi:hypothetical protein
MKYLLYYIIFSLIIIAFAYFNSLHNNIEAFTPKINTKIKEKFNPIVRNTRISIEKFKNNGIGKLSDIIEGLI